MAVNEKYRSLFVSFLFLALIQSTLNAQIDFSYQSDYYYLRGKDAVSLPATWNKPGFDCSAWSRGKAPFRYGNGEGGTDLSDMQNSFTTFYLVSEFECQNKDLLKEIVIAADYDDGFVIWINGSEALSINSPAVPSYNSVAPANHESGTGEYFTLDATGVGLVNGTNLIAIQGFNVSLNSSDFYLDFEIHAEKTLPQLTDTLGLDFSVKSGFYDSPFSLSLSSPDPALEITYTLDGSNPQNSLTGFTVPNPALILIDPESTAGRPATPSVTVRASSSKPGMKPALSSTRTYIFPEKVRTQKWPGGTWPNNDINGQLIDLDMDPEVVGDPLYASQLTGSLLGIPSVSIVTDNRNLFDPASGIYVNAKGHGLGWEKECMLPGKRNYGGEAAGRWLQLQSAYDHLIMSHCYDGEFYCKSGRVKISHRFNQAGRVDFVELKFLRALDPCLNGEIRKLLLVRDYPAIRRDWHAAEAFILPVLPRELVFLYEDIFKCPRPEVMAWLVNIGHRLVSDLLEDLRVQPSDGGVPDGGANGDQLRLQAVRADEVAVPILNQAAALECAVELNDPKTALVRYLGRP